MPNLPLSRDQLAKFLPNQETIRAFEELMNYVGEAGPAGTDEILALLNGLRRNNTAELSARMADAEAQPAQRVNLSAVLARLDALEQLAARRSNLSAILTRIENLEKLTGV